MPLTRSLLERKMGTIWNFSTSRGSDSDSPERTLDVRSKLLFTGTKMVMFWDVKICSSRFVWYRALTKALTPPQAG